MKRIEKKIRETNFSKLKAYAICNTSNAVRAKDYKNTEFSIDGYVVTDVKITDDDDTTREMTSLCLLTTDGVIIATNSIPMLDNFYNMLAVMNDENINISDVKMIIREGKCKEGSFNSIEFVL